MNIVRNDKHDLDPTEGKLIHIGHFLWKLYTQTKDDAGLEAALTCAWAAKREYRAELKAQREESARQLREYWAARKAA
jgi:hypothetical protein